MPEHRSAALATQAKMLYVLLYFAPEVLEEQHHTMREIVDRRLRADAYWVVPYMGFLEELPHVWEPQGGEGASPTCARRRRSSASTRTHALLGQVAGSSPTT